MVNQLPLSSSSVTCYFNVVNSLGKCGDGFVQAKLGEECDTALAAVTGCDEINCKSKPYFTCTGEGVGTVCTADSKTLALTNAPARVTSIVLDSTAVQSTNKIYQSSTWPHSLLMEVVAYWDLSAQFDPLMTKIKQATLLYTATLVTNLGSVS